MTSLQDSATIKVGSSSSDVKPDVSTLTETPAMSAPTMVAGLDSGGAPKPYAAKSSTAENETIPPAADSLAVESQPQPKPQASVPAALPMPETFPTLKPVLKTEECEAPLSTEDSSQAAGRTVVPIDSGSADQTSQHSADPSTARAAVASEQGTSVAPASDAASEVMSEGTQREEEFDPRLSIDQSVVLEEEPLAAKVPAPTTYTHAHGCQSIRRAMNTVFYYW